jgi:hypothetical protein
MTFGCFARSASFVLTLSTTTACGGAIVRDERPPPEGESEPPPRETRADAPVPRAAVPEDSKSLRVDIGIYVEASADVPAAAVGVMVAVNVYDADTGAEVRDAHVRGGPVGRAVELPLHDGPYMAVPSYLATFVGYERAWEFSIVRGRDRLTHAALLGPSYPSVIVTRASATTLAVRWSPAHEANVTTSVCAWGTPSRADLEIEGGCAESEGQNDEGSVVVTPPVLPKTWITFHKHLDGLAVGSRGGTASIRLYVRADAPSLQR